MALPWGINLAPDTKDEIKPSDYVSSFVANLDNPQRVWEFAYNNHLSKSAVKLLNVLISMDRPVFTEDLQKAFNSFQQYYANKFHNTYSEYDFKKALKELEDDFIMIERSGDKILIDFHNPSIADFLEFTIRKEKELFIDLVNSAEFPDQIHTLFLQIKNTQFNQEHLESISKCMLEKFYSLFNSPTMGLVRYRSTYSNEYTNWRHKYISKEQLFLWAIDIWNLLRNPELIPHLNLIKKIYFEWFKNHQSSLENLIDIAEYIRQKKIPEESIKGELFTLLKRQILAEIDPFEAQIEDFRAISIFLAKFSANVSEDKKIQISKLFLEFSDYEFDAISQQRNDPELMFQMLEDLEEVSNNLGVDLNIQIENLRAEAFEIQPYDNESEDRMYSSENHDYSQSDAEIDSMFQSLADKIDC